MTACADQLVCGVDRSPGLEIVTPRGLGGGDPGRDIVDGSRGLAICRVQIAQLICR